MDVHPPHHPVESWRDFFIHLGTITIGLLIALSLEGMVEWAHHRELVARARDNLRQEIRDNRSQAESDLKAVHEDEARMAANLETERRLRDRPKNFHGAISFIFSWSSMNDSAWNTARDTGALGYMAYTDVQHYADLYGQQAIVNNVAIDVFREQTRALGPLKTEADIDHLPPAEVARLLDQTATVSVDLQTLEQTLSQLREQYTVALGKP